MDVAQAWGGFTTIQSALYTLSLLQLTSYRYPQPTSIQNGSTFDYIVVGAGSAGAVIANRLTENENTTVLLLEAGGDPPLESNLPGLLFYPVKSHVDWNYTTPKDNHLYQCHDNNEISLTRGKMLGGSSSLDHMLYVRASPHDYDHWASLVNDKSWRYENILKYFIKSERMTTKSILESPTSPFHGIHGYLGVSVIESPLSDAYIKSFGELGYDILEDYNGDKFLGYSKCQAVVSDGIRQSTANAFLTPIKDRKNLFILKNHLVTKIIINEQKVAEGVEVRDNTGRKLKFYAKDEVVVSAGAINSPQLLMLSGIGPKDHLNSLGIEVEADLPVGENLQDHFSVIGFIKLDKNLGNAPPLDPTRYPVPSINGFVALNKSQNYADYQLQTLTLDENVAMITCLAFSIDAHNCQYFFDQYKGYNVLFFAHTSFKADGRGTLLLRSTNPDDQPIVNFKPLVHIESNAQQEVENLKDFARILDTEYFKSLGAELITPPGCLQHAKGSEAYWRCYMTCIYTSIYHASGTTEMGKVVDSRLRVKGIENLRVADAGIMPVVTNGNTNAPTIMIGEKAADMIKEDNGLQF